MGSDPYAPTKADRFTFGLWTTGSTGRDPFGLPTREPLSLEQNLRGMAAIGAWGFNFHDEDIIPPGTTPAEATRIKNELRHVMEECDLVCSMSSANLFTNPVFRDGAYTSSDARVRAYAIQKSIRAIDFGVELGSKLYVCWGGREGAETDAAKNPQDALKRYREAIDYLCGYILDQRYDMRVGLEAKPSEPRGDIYLPTTGAMLGFIATLSHPEMVGVNPEFAHETMTNLNFHHALAQALEAGKLFHVDLNSQRMGRFDQDLRFGSEDLKGTFFLVHLLESSGYKGARHFDAHAYRSESPEGVWDFARGCIRTYRILAEKSRRFRKDAEIQGLLAECREDDERLTALTASYSSANAKRLNEITFDLDAMCHKKLPYERLDQLTLELLMGIR
ncbi:MAG: xylose isomerase [Planctomycetota bacterium]